MDYDLSNSPDVADDPISRKAAAMLRGFLGMDPKGSVLDPRYAADKKLQHATEGASLISDLLPGKAALSGIVPMALGALRRGGRPDLFLSHGASAANLVNKDTGKLINELTHPSFAITKDTPRAPFGDVMLIPREGKFDPRTSPSSLHSTDAWTPHWSDSLENDLKYNQQGIASQRDLARARLDDKFKNRFEKGGLNVVSPNEAIIGSTRYPSFEAYEKNFPKNPQLPTSFWKKLDQDMEQDVLARIDPDELDELMGDPDALQEIMTDQVNPTDFIKRLLANDANTITPAGAKDKVEYARKILQKIRNAEPDYAELKQWGNVQLSPDNFAGAFIKNGPDAMRVSEALRQRGITATPWAQDYASRARQADIMQAKARRLLGGHQ